MLILASLVFVFFFFNDTATTEIYTLSLHDALPISHCVGGVGLDLEATDGEADRVARIRHQLAEPLHHLHGGERSEEHTSELQSLAYLVCRLLLEKKKTINDFRQCKAHILGNASAHT